MQFPMIVIAAAALAPLVSSTALKPSANGWSAQFYNGNLCEGGAMASQAQIDEMDCTDIAEGSKNPGAPSFDFDFGSEGKSWMMFVYTEPKCKGDQYPYPVPTSCEQAPDAGIGKYDNWRSYEVKRASW